MTWLLAEILAFVLAAAVFGVLIGLGLAAAGANRRAVSLEKEHHGLLDQIQAFDQSQRAIEVRAEARSAAEAAVRGDLEGRLVEFETAAEEYRARAEAAERQLRVLARPDYSPRVEPPPAAPEPRADQAEIESLKKAVTAAEALRCQAKLDLRRAEAERDVARAAAHAATGGAEAERARSGQEIESLALQLATAERVRAKCEAELALAHARAEAVMRSAAALMGAGNPLAAAGRPWDAPVAPADANAAANGNGAFTPPSPMPDERDRPPALAAPRGGQPDDLRRIRGIGPRNEGALNALGLYHFQQIAGLTAANVAWLDAYLRVHGRIAREDWVGQAKSLIDARARPEISDKVRPEDAGF